MSPKYINVQCDCVSQQFFKFEFSWICPNSWDTYDKTALFISRPLQYFIHSSLNLTKLCLGYYLRPASEFLGDIAESDFLYWYIDVTVPSSVCLKVRRYRNKLLVVWCECWWQWRKSPVKRVLPTKSMSSIRMCRLYHAIAVVRGVWIGHGR